MPSYKMQRMLRSDKKKLMKLTEQMNENNEGKKLTCVDVVGKLISQAHDKGNNNDGSH